MAAIFQIRRGTSNISIVDGELYLHKGSGSIQFGSGSTAYNLLPLNAPTNGDIILTGNITASNAYFTGDVAISGNLFLGNSANEDTITAGGEFTSNLIPNPTNTYSLGSSTKVWKDVHATSISGAIAATNGVISGSSQLDTSFEEKASETHTLVSGSSQIIGILDSLNDFSASVTSSLESIYQTTSSLNEFTESLLSTTNDYGVSIDELNEWSGSAKIQIYELENKSESVDNSLSQIHIYTSSLKTAIAVDGVNTTILGNLSVLGTTTTVNSNEVNIGDNILHLNYGYSAIEAGLQVTDVTGGSVVSGSLLWDGTTDYWKAGKKGAESKILLADGDSVISSSLQLTELNLFTQSTNTRLGLLETSTGSLNTFTSSTLSRFTFLEISTGSLNSFSASVISSLENIYQTTASLNEHSTSLNTFSGNVNIRFDNLQTYTTSVDSKFTTLETYTGSVNSDLTSIHQTTASLNLFTASAYVSFSLITASIEDHEERVSYLEGIGGISGGNPLTQLHIFSASAKISIANLESFTSSIDTTIKNKLNLDGVVSGSLQVLGGSGVWSSSVQMPEGVVSGSSQVNIYDLENYSTFYDALYTDINGKEEIASATHTLISGSLQVLDGSGVWSGSAQLPAGVISGSSQILGGTGIVSGSSQIVPLLPTGVVSGSAQVITANSITLGTHTTGNYVQTIVGDTERGLTVAGSGLESADVTLTLAQGIKTDSNPQFSSLGIGTAASGVGGEIRATGDIVAFYSSDERLKSNIQPIGDALDKVNQISGNVYDWKKGFENIHSHTGTDIGVIAQEIEKVLPQAVIDRESGYKAVNYEKIVPLLIEAIKELSLKVKELENK